MVKCLGYVIPIASYPAIYSMLSTWTLEAVYCAIKFISVIEASRFITFKVESQSQMPSPQFGHQMCALCWRPFTTCTVYTGDNNRVSPLYMCAYFSHLINLLEFFHISTMFDTFNKSLNPSISNAGISKTIHVHHKRETFMRLCEWIQDKIYSSLFISAQYLRFAIRAWTPSPLPIRLPWRL